jgi:protein phosphatase
VIVLALIATVLGVCYGAYTYTQSTAYLADENGKVAVYQGVPDTVLGISLSHLDHVTDVNVDDLQPGVSARLKEGVIRADSLDAANSLVDGYQEDIAAGKKPTAEAEQLDASTDAAASSSSADASASSSADAGTSSSADVSVGSTSSAQGGTLQ